MTDTAGTPDGPERPDDDAPATEPDDGGTHQAPGADGETTAAPSSGTDDNDTAEATADSATPAGSTPDAETPAGNGGKQPAGRRRHWLRWTALGASVVVLAAAGVGWSLYRKLEGNITQDTGTASELERYDKERPPPSKHDALNILLIGSDTRAGSGNKPYGRDVGSQRSDTTILLHLAADRKSATAVSLPRDLMVDLPSCRKANGSRTKEQFAQFNGAFQVGGAACTIRTVEKLTKVRIDHHMVVDFQGFKKMVDAVDGVVVCLKNPVDDPDSRLKLSAGRHRLDGEQALGYVRARKTLGNGSDTDRMDRQQQFLAALVKKVQSNGVLLNPTKLYPVLDAATSSLTTDPALAGLTDLYDLVRSMRNIPTEKVQFLTVPRQSYEYDANRDELVQPAAGRLFEQLRKDAPLHVSDRNEESAARDKNEAGEGKADKKTKSEQRDEGDTDDDSDVTGDGQSPDAGEDFSRDLYDDGDYFGGSDYFDDGKSPARDPRLTGPHDIRLPAAEEPDSPSDKPSPVPTFRGNTADDSTCE
ncbi:putative transcriptional regulator YwtF [Streptomyces sp. YIM 130001]|nr:putative transcriptional regulator YwtF [Streptomyces sp. YIM 130001]